ncbi:kinase-like protein [Aulographum hederae CBS 113979]|uniref:non-specific serine/threonine protein kinase n=1 Tax=Aulographum hederae CBS 113979 TaxID=1176131 RepID=A0A6G1GVY8_9PEZI|nr:kinase-like protein [Aulographum hederae CBS 113979]
MADNSRGRTMSLIPYAPAESREVVLRHGSAVVVFDQESRQLSIRDASHATTLEVTDCPYCHRPLREDTPPYGDYEDYEREDSPHARPEAHFMSPEYFRLLQHSTPPSNNPSRPPSPHKQLPARREPSGASARNITPVGAEFLGSTPAAPSSHGINRKFFSADYFKTFFMEEKVLGRGGKGVVLLVTHVLDGVSLGKFACKRVPVGDDHEWLEKVLVEVQLLQNLSHQNLVSYRHVWLEDFQISTFGPSVPCAFILQQYCNAGDLHHYILDSAQSKVTTEQLKERVRRKSKGQLDKPIDLHGPRHLQLEEIFSFFKDITSGLDHLHRNKFIHRDLKPSNCLLDRSGPKLRVLISDFGEVQSVNVMRQSSGATGTISYCAPEVLRRERPGGAYGNFSTKSDIFSLGMIVYFMCFGRLPYSQADDINEENENIELLRDEIAEWTGFNSEAGDELLRARKDLPDRLYRFLKRLLSLQPAERPSTEEILQGIRTGAGLEEFAADMSQHPSLLDASRSRISPADSPQPSPGKRASASYGRPGPSNLRAATSAASMENRRSPTPPLSPTASRASPSVGGEGRATTTASLPSVSPSSQLRPQLSPRMLLPPPPSLLQRLQHSLQGNDSRTLPTLLKLTLLLLKITSLSRACAPFAATWYVTYPLILLALLDFVGLGDADIRRRMGLPRVLFEGFRGSVGLFAIHVGVVKGAERVGWLCLGREVSGVAWGGV